jgi:DNA repair protein RecO (recombination protein O)
MAFKKTEAIVIKTVNLREADRIITFFSRDYGKMQGIAKSVRKIKSRYGGKLELFTRVNVILFQKLETMQSNGFHGPHPLLPITQVDVVESFLQLKTDFNRIVGASYIAEFLNRVFEEYDNTHKGVYPLVCETFQTLCVAKNIRNILPAFEVKLLTHLGYTPVLDRCAACKKPIQPPPQNQQNAARMTIPLGFSSATGGVLCQRCRPLKKDHIPVSWLAIYLLRQFLTTHMRQVPTLTMSKEVHQHIKTLLTNYFQYHVGIVLKTESFVQKLRAAKLSP